MELAPGMDVLCIDGHGLAKTGSQYVIERVWPDRDVVSLVGIVPSDPLYALFYHGTFASRRFRPIRKTDIGELQKLTKVNELEDA